MIIIFVYISISVFVALGFGLLSIRSSVILNRNPVGASGDPLISAGEILMAIFWPISLIMILIIGALDSYRESLRQEADKILSNIKKDTDLTCISNKDIKKLIFANNFGAIQLGEEMLKKIKKHQQDKEFEGIFLS